MKRKLNVREMLYQVIDDQREADRLADAYRRLEKDDPTVAANLVEVTNYLAQQRRAIEFTRPGPERQQLETDYCYAVREIYRLAAQTRANGIVPSEVR